MKAKRNSGFTLVEILIVVVILAVLAATIIPQFTDSTTDAKRSTAQFNLKGLRGQLELYKAHHNGEYPTTLGLLAVKTNDDHSIAGTPARGPYCPEIPVEPLTNSDDVATSTNEPIGAITGTTGGWIYNATTGEIRINHKDYDEF